MNFKRILGIIICLCGLVLIGISFYIKSRVAEGRTQIAEGQQKIDQTKGLFSIVPQTKSLGNALTKSGEQRIAMGQQEIAEYEALAHKLQIGGIVLIILGAGAAIFFGNRRA